MWWFSRWLVSDSCNAMDCSPLGSSVRGILQARILEWGSHFLLQGIFPTQGSNPGLLRCRQILYQLSYKESPVESGTWSEVKWSEVAQSCPTLCDSMDCSLPGSSVHVDSLGKNTGVGWQLLLQGIFPTQESNPGLLRCRQILYQLSYKGSPKMSLLLIKKARYMILHI